MKSFIFIVIGIILAATGVSGFLLPNQFIDGGITGVSMLISDVFNVDLALIIVIVNTPFILFSIKKMSVRFAVKGAIAIMGFAAAVHYIPFPAFTDDKILGAIFGGISLGAGIGLAFRGGAVLDGTEILAIVLSHRIGVRVGDVILAFNTVIFCLVAVLLGLDRAMYSILTYMAASRAVDFLVYGFDALGVNIISKQSEAIKSALLEELGVGVTVFLGRRGSTKQEQEILFCACSRLEIAKVRAVIDAIDHDAFVSVHKIADSKGGVLRRFHKFGH